MAASARRPFACLIGAAFAFASGCSEDCPSPIEDCIENSVSLQQGVYGRVVDQNDVRINDCPSQLSPWPQNPMSLFVVGSDVAMAEDISDQNGIYELPASPGDYRVCRSSGTCVAVTVPMNGRVRVDLALPFAMFTVRDAAMCEQ